MSLDVVDAIAAGPWRCPVMSCNLPFATEDLRDAHRRDVHAAPITERRLPEAPQLKDKRCAYCPEMFATNQSRGQHERWRHREQAVGPQPSPIPPAATDRLVSEGAPMSAVKSNEKCWCGRTFDTVQGITMHRTRSGHQPDGSTVERKGHGTGGGNAGGEKSPVVSTPKAPRRAKPTRGGHRGSAPKRPLKRPRTRGASSRPPRIGAQPNGEVTLSVAEGLAVAHVLEQWPIDGPDLGSIKADELVLAGVLGRIRGNG